ncbi:AraC family transcriptional regulator [Pseudonocardia sp. ICBG601]|uniref:helix-turn-helix domain-containing protein n=2 Tax=unclassified Pseudonocardia TaxID=2619320 RepID=UPI001CF6B1F8|nr:AraC family transcriptional regulator [Pseudonocardia sp. ICBG601]
MNGPMMSSSRQRRLTVGVHVRDERPDRRGDRVWTRWTSPPPADVHVRVHQHPCHELVWAASGPRTVEIDRLSWIVPVGAGIWIPAGTPHRGVVTGRTGYRCTFVEPGRWAPELPPGVVRFGPAWAGLVEHLDRGDLPEEARRRAEAVALDSVEPVTGGVADLPMPTDPRLALVARGIVAAPGAAHPAEVWSRRVGWSARTLLRRFREETGMTFAQWRTQARVRAAARLLAEGRNVTETAHAVGYRTASSFVRAFREATGRTPGALGTTGRRSR